MTLSVDPQTEKLRQRARRYWPLRGLTMTLPGATRVYRIAQPAFPEDLLDQLITPPARSAASPLRPSANPHNTGIPLLRSAAAEARRNVDAGRLMPYWGLPWPSGLALAEALLASMSSPTQDKPIRALELGCGLGVTATVALDLGLTLAATDCFPGALAFCRYNTQRNTRRTPATCLADWRTETGRAALARAAPYDLLLAADVLYEDPDIALLLELAPRLVGSGGRFWLAEPGRRASLSFIGEALARGWHDDPTVYERIWPPDGDYARVAVHRLVLP